MSSTKPIVFLEEALKSQKATTPIFDGGVLRGKSCSYLINLDGLFSIEFTLIILNNTCNKNFKSCCNQNNTAENTCLSG